MSTIKNVAITGASGSLGSVVLQKLLNAKDLNVLVLRRNGSSAAFPAEVKVIDVDFDSIDSLTAALQGQDAVIATVGMGGVAPQIKLIDAAIAAGVQRFIPSEFGSDLSVPKTRALPVFGEKVKVSDYLHEKAAAGKITYTDVYNSAFADWGLKMNFILDHSNYQPKMWDGGNSTFSTTTLDSVANGVVGILSHLDETKNRPVYLEDMKITQKQLLEMARQVAPERPWAPQDVSIDETVAKSDERIAQGIYDRETLVPYIFKACLQPEYGCNFEKNDMALLGVKQKTEEDLFKIVKQYVK